MSQFITSKDASKLVGERMPDILRTVHAALVGRTIKSVGYTCDEGGAFPTISCRLMTRATVPAPSWRLS